MAREEEGKWRLLNPLTIRYSQPRIAPHFRDGRLLAGTVEQVSEAPLAEDVADWHPRDAAEGVPPYDVVLVPPFPAIRVISWLPKIRRPDGEAERDVNGDQILGKRAWFALDNRRLNTVQVVAARRWPRRCCVAVRCIEEVPGSSTSREIRKFRTTTEGRIVDVGIRAGETSSWSWAEAVPEGAEVTNVEPEGLFAEDLWDARTWAPHAVEVALRSSSLATGQTGHDKRPEPEVALRSSSLATGQTGHDKRPEPEDMPKPRALCGGGRGTGAAGTPHNDGSGGGGAGSGAAADSVAVGGTSGYGSGMYGGSHGGGGFAGGHRGHQAGNSYSNNYGNNYRGSYGSGNGDNYGGNYGGGYACGGCGRGRGRGNAATYAPAGGRGGNAVAHKTGNAGDAGTGDSAYRGGRLMSCPENGWQYIDPAGKIQGPFELEKMRLWHGFGYFRSDLPMRCDPGDAFLPFETIFPQPIKPFQADVLRYAQ
eukprot:TRINITY_DN10304_c0_g1_i1.p1 TRINITY_DN10304_c0_g1~~TRINITY_DN10304_c0_g1_i1.p1  ORF type:complete len:496 (+),score=68.93 TRINITY_DN10304_c0_g1_i1:49-1488(+)